MEYTITEREKRRQRNLPYQFWRLAVLSVRFMKLTRLGSECALRARLKLSK